MNDDQPRYSTLRDYLALLGRQKLVVIAVTLVFGGAALALSASQEESYQAEASTQFNDIARDVSIIGTVELPADTNPLVNAAIKAEEITSLETARKVKKRLETDFSPDRLQSAIETQVGAQTIFVQITATWEDPQFAARLADTFAEVAVDEENTRFSRQLRAAIKELEPQAQGALLENGVVNLSRLNAQNQLGAVRNLKTQVDQGVITPAELSRRAEIPGEPSSPRTFRNTVLGVIIGFALGLLAAFARDALDRRLRTAKDAHEAFGWPVLGRVAKTALGSTGVARNAAGAGLVTPADVESFRMLRTNLGALTGNGAPRSVLVTSGLPQEGKSTVAASLAAASAAAGQRTLLVDADLRRPTLATRLGMPANPGLAEYLAGTVEPQQILHTISVGAMGRSMEGEADPDRALVAIPAGNPKGEPAELLASDRCRDFLQKVSRAYDLVVIDSSPLLATADPLELVPHVESVLICVRMPSSTRDESRAVRDAVGLLPERPTGLVVTAVGTSDGYYGYYGY